MKRLLKDRQGASAVELAMTAPLYMAVLFGVAQTGLALWTQLGIEHGAEMAARCASINPSTCSSASATQNYAVSESFGLSIPASTFSLATPACGNQVSASYVYSFITLVFGSPHVTLTARSCFPK